jgi:hypothetical protein
MPVTVYKSTDGSAPTLNGTAGSLVTVLDAILVNGYGAKAAAGWAKEFSGTNKAVYRAAAGARHRLRVQDDAPRAAPFNDGREARVRGFEAMSAVDTGTEAFPTTTQFANGLFVRKSLTADSTARAWVCVADGKTIYFYVKSMDYTGYGGFMFGEFFSLKSTADAYRSILIARSIEQIAATPVARDADESLFDLAAPNAVIAGHYIPRIFTETAQAVQVGKHGQGAHSASSLAGLLQYPNPVDAGLYLSQVWVHEDTGTAACIRGRMRGFWHFLHPVASAVNDGDTWSGTGPLAGKTFLAIKPTADGRGIIVMETSDTWETN